MRGACSMAPRAAASPVTSPPAPSARDARRLEHGTAVHTPKKARTSGSGTGQAKKNEKKPRGFQKRKDQGWCVRPKQHAAPTNTEQPPPKRRRTTGDAATASIAAAGEAERQDLTAGADDGKAYRKARPVISFTARRFAIAVAFVEIFGAPPRCEWNSLRDADDDTGSRAQSC